MLTDAVRRVAEGECVIDPTIVSRLMSRRRDSGPFNQLTSREREVLALMAEGHSNQGICDRLFLSPKTIEAHISQIFSKLGLRDTLGYHRRVLAVLAFLRTFDRWPSTQANSNPRYTTRAYALADDCSCVSDSHQI